MKHPFIATYMTSLTIISTSVFLQELKELSEAGICFGIGLGILTVVLAIKHTSFNNQILCDKIDDRDNIIYDLKAKLNITATPPKAE